MDAEENVRHQRRGCVIFLYSYVWHPVACQLYD